MACLPIKDPKIVEVRDELVDKAFSGATLDRETLVPIFGALGVASGNPSRSALSFSFTRPDTAPERAHADLAAALETLTASEEVERALIDATERLKADTSEEIYAEQQRLIEAQRGLRQRLAHLAGTD